MVLTGHALGLRRGFTDICSKETTYPWLVLEIEQKLNLNNDNVSYSSIRVGGWPRSKYVD